MVFICKVPQTLRRYTVNAFNQFEAGISQTLGYIFPSDFLIISHDNSERYSVQCRGTDSV